MVFDDLLTFSKLKSFGMASDFKIWLLVSPFAPGSIIASKVTILKCQQKKKNNQIDFSILHIILKSIHLSFYNKYYYNCCVNVGASSSETVKDLVRIHNYLLSVAVFLNQGSMVI